MALLFTEVQLFHFPVSAEKSIFAKSVQKYLELMLTRKVERRLWSTNVRQRVDDISRPLRRQPVRDRHIT